MALLTFFKSGAPYGEGEPSTSLAVIYLDATQQLLRLLKYRTNCFLALNTHGELGLPVDNSATVQMACKQQCPVPTQDSSQLNTMCWVVVKLPSGVRTAIRI